MPQPNSPRALIFAMCVAQLLTMLSLSVYAAQLPNLSKLWSLNNTQAGWIGAAYFVGYTIAVPVLTSLTDRIDPKKIYLFGVVLLAAGCAGLGGFAMGAESAAFFHAIAGAGLAGSYMPGLKGLVDHLPEELQSRATAVYTASFGFGAAASYPFSAWLGEWFGWPMAFFGCAVSAILAGFLVLFALPKADPARLNLVSTRLLDFRPVLRNRAALAYTLGYAMHCWELFALRTWVVAYLVYAEQLHGAAPAYAGPAAIAALLTIVGVPASILGNEFSMHAGRLRVVCIVMIVSALVCLSIGMTAEIAYALAALFCVIHGITVIFDSGSLTAGALGNAQPGYRGATMAVHSTLGFAGATMGPLMFGWTLDLAGGQSGTGWWAAFAHIALVSLAGVLILAILRPPPVAGDRR
jgi:MFS family permease